MEYTLSENLKRILKKVWIKDKSIYIYFIIYTLFAAIYPFLGIFLPKLIIGELIKDVPVFKNIVIYVGAFFILVSIIGFIKAMTEHVSYFKIAYIRLDYFNDLSKKHFAMDFKYTEDPKFLDEHQNASSAVSNHHEGLEGSIHLLFSSGALVLSIIGYIYLVSNLSIWIFVYLVFNVIVNFFIVKAVKKYEYSFKDDISNINRKKNYYMETTHDFRFGKDIRLYDMSEKILQRYDNEVVSIVSVYRKIESRRFKMALIEILLIMLREGLVYGYLIFAFINGQIRIDDFAMYLITIATLSQTMNLLVSNISNYVGLNQYVKDLFQLLDKDLVNNYNTLDIPSDFTYEIEFRDVSFKYPNTDKYIYKNFNLKINKGEKIAIVGINGAGKTTLVKLLARLYDLEEGAIYLNGVNIKDYDKEQYYKLFSVVFQEFKLFAFNAKENIALDYENIDEDKVIKSLQKVNMLEKINNLPNGLESNFLKIIDPNGVEFSGGETQKLAIARALYKDAPIVILDEPTASLDALAEQEIYEEFNELVKGKTSIYISHRLASTKFCDRIVLINDAQIEECGTHEELLNLKRHYYQMFMTQAKYYIEGESHE